MKFTFKKGTHAYVGNMPLTFLDDTEVDVVANSRDHIAEMMASGGQRAFGEHLESLNHQTTVKRMVEGKEHEVDVDVTYGAGGARVETDRGEPRPIGGTAAKSQQPAGQPGTIGALKNTSADADQAAAATGGIGTETVPGASGSGENFEGGKGSAPVASDDGQDVETERLRSVPRTEFVVPPKRFPDEVQTHTDPPRAELVADSPERETPYVGEFNQTGAFSRQPSLDRGPGYPFPEGQGGAVSDREATAGRPAPTPDTPGTRDREFPAPSESAMSRPDQTAVALNVVEKGSDQLSEAPAAEGDAKAEAATKENTSTESDDLPADFPHYDLLVSAGVSKYSQLEGKTAEDLSGEDFPGIGPAKAEDILAELKRKKKADAK